MPMAALPPEAPFSPCVKTVSDDVALTVTAPAEPAQVVPSMIVAVVVLLTTLIPADPPTPTLLPLAPPAEGSARAKFCSLLDAVTLTAPAPEIVTFGAANAALSPT